MTDVPEYSHAEDSESFEHAERLIGIFGRWPCFHDAEVVRVSLDRHGADGPLLEARIRVFQMTGEVDSRGSFVLEDETLVTLEFHGVDLEYMHGFNNQNVLFDLTVTHIDPAENEGRRLRIEMPPSYGLRAELTCTRAVVAAVEPFRRDG
jgi:hypothetical protein